MRGKQKQLDYIKNVQIESFHKDADLVTFMMNIYFQALCSIFEKLFYDFF